ncbi:protein phosphatase [Streptomyces sp. WM4235]|uniref:SpoIIE family protein phosphatase n=1 Tax=Streptomyces sp. WM4235 TaxID=1415551 RepID=UPI0006C5F233|nr:SpoIIE family protein phosphatase [Streptomyces sp. WM4235]KOU40487.1 protein phosphatase [Streptomyces sp. WM4235]
MIEWGLGGENLSPTGARERFLEGEPVEDGVRSLILNSWRRCHLMGVSPDTSDPPYWEDLDLTGPLVHAADPVLDRLQAVFSGSRANVGLADRRGAVLSRRFGVASLERDLPAHHSRPGFVFAEQFAGTNGIALALAERRLCQVYGAEHFSERSQSNACWGMPIRDPLSGHIEGVLALGCPRLEANPAMTTVMRNAARAIEHRLLERSTERERSLLRAYFDARQRSNGDGALSDVYRFGVDDLVQSGLEWRDQMIVQEKAAELISSAQRAAAVVVLSDGRRVTLLSRPLTSASGVAGFVVEAILPLDVPWQRHLLSPHFPESAPLLSAPVQAPATPVPHSRPPAAPVPAAGRADGLVLVGEPSVGRLAVAARRRLELLAEASTRIGTTLDVRRTAWELAEVAVPRLADFVTIDLPEAVLRGDESADPRTDLHRTVVHGIREDCPFYPVGERVDLRPSTPHLRCLDSMEAVLETDLKTAAGWLAQDFEHTERLLTQNVHSLISAPLLARGVVLGIATFYRAQDSAPFGNDDLSLAQEFVARAALCIDNARRYTREHATVLALQRSLLPHSLPEQGTVELAHRYLPAESSVGGDWFDVIPLSGTRVALLVGDVVGHGLHAAATMGHLRTATRNFAELDLAPDEVLTHLDNLVGRLDGGDGGRESLIGATCLYAIYDPTTQMCTMARAGHPPPALVSPDGSVSFPDLPAGLPLGLGGLPFETAEIHLPENSSLVLYTDGLIEDRHRDIDEDLARLRRALAHPDRAPEETCDAIMATVAPRHPEDDIALLVARTHALPPDRIATWDLPADPARVCDVRAAAVRRLADWGLEEVAFATELLLSEMVTNAVRYGGEPIRVRLIHDRSLICEVYDGSSTSPRLRQATSTDEGGRGLFLVAQLAQAWGTRYTADGKVIWAEFTLAPTVGASSAGWTDVIAA